ncbi:MAG: tyrosine-type recombinase/integrase, partial [Bacteroidales bacterium]
MAKKYKKRKDGRYETKVTVGHDYETGEPIRVPVYGKTIPELENNKALVKADYLRGYNIVHSNITFIDYAEKWLKLLEMMLKEERISPKTYDQKKRNVYNHCKSLHYKQMKSIIKSDLQDVIKANWKHPRTCEQIRDCMHQIFEDAIDDKLIIQNPCRRLKMPGYKDPDKRALTYNEDYLTDIVEYTDREKAFILLIKWFGLRRGEALAAQKQYFDFEKNNFNVDWQVIFDVNKPILKLPKGEKKRVVPIIDKPKQFLKYYISNLDSDFLFTNLTTGELITQTGFRRMWESIMNKTLKRADELSLNESFDFTPHTFRHNFSTWMREWGIDDKERQYILGH